MFLIWKPRVIWETHHLSAQHFHFDTNLKKKLHGKIKCELFEFTYLPIWSWEDSLLKVVQLSNTVVRIAIPLNLLYLLFLRELHRMVVTEVYGMGKSWNKNDNIIEFCLHSLSGRKLHEMFVIEVIMEQELQYLQYRSILSGS